MNFNSADWPGRQIGPQDISFVLQGPVESARADEIGDGIARLRALAPGCEVIISTWHGAPGLDKLGADQLVLSPDPGSLPGIRRGGEHPNNVNRQILSSHAGLRRASRPYSVKMRTDTVIAHPGFVALYEQFAEPGLPGQIVLPAFFTLDPAMFEQVPYHASDWFHFGRTSDLRAYWAAPFMSEDDATYYGRHPYAPHSSYLDRKFFCRLAVEQYIAVAYATGFGLAVPAFHNDIRPEVLADHNHFMSRFLIVGDMAQLGIELPKYEWASQSSFQDLNCLTHQDWLGLRGNMTTGIKARQKRKRLTRAIYRTSRPILPMLYSKRMRGLVMAALNVGRP